MDIIAHYDFEKTPEQNLECLRSLVEQGHNIEIERFPYHKCLGQFVFKYSITNCSFMNIRQGTSIVDKDNVARVIKHQNTDHVYTCEDGKQVIIGDFEISE